jgi:uncharacterized repeat protein (TIGR01451 family)
MKTRIPSIIKSILFASALTLVPYALIPHAGTAMGYLGNGAEALACPIKSITVDPPSQTIHAGEDASYRVTIGLYPKFPNFTKGPIILWFTGLPSGVSCPSIEIPYKEGDLSVEGTLSITKTCITPETYRNIKVSAVAILDDGSRDPSGIHPSVELTINPSTGGFTISGDSQTPPEVNPGETAEFAISGDFTGCFDGPVSLSVDDSTLPAGVTVQSFSPDTISVKSPASTLTFKTAADTPAGEYEITVRGVSGDLSDDTVVTLVVTEPAPCFSVDVHPENRNIKAGEEGENDFFTVVTNWCEGYTGDVTLSVDGLPDGVTYTFDDNPVSPQGNSNNGNAETKLRIYSECYTPPGEYTITVTGTADTPSAKMVSVESPYDTATLTVTEGDCDFSLSSNPTSRDIEPGETATYTITVNEGGSLPAYTVNFPEPSVIAGMTAKIEPTSLPPTSNTNSVTLTVKTDTTVQDGIYTITVEAEGGGYTDSVTVELTVKKPPEKFSLSAGSQTPSDLKPGETAEFKVNAHNFADEVTFSITGALPVGVKDATIKPTVLPVTGTHDWVTLTVETDTTITEGTYDIAVRGVCGDQTDEVVVTLVVGKAPETAGLSVDKSVSPSSAKVGGMLLYTVEISNTGRGPLKEIVVRDHMPAGVGYVKGSTTIDGRKATEPSGTTTLIWEIDTIEGGDSVTLKYHGVVKPNISRGKSTNTVTIIGTDATGRTLTARASADLGVSSETLERKGKIKGKVFIDENGNGLKNVDEEGIAGVWIIMESGERTSTDEEGMFQFDEVDSGQHLVAVDVRKLSKEYFVVGDSSKIVSIFSGGTGRTYFGLGRTGPTKEELEALKKTEEEALKKEEEARKEEEKKKAEEEKERNAPKGTLFGNVFVDANDNNIYNPGEKRLEKVTVLLDATKRAVTDNVGNYRFDKVKEGRHTLSIREDQEFKKSYRLSKKERITVNVKASTNNRKDIPVLDKSKLKINIELTVR